MDWRVIIHLVCCLPYSSLPRKPEIRASNSRVLATTPFHSLIRPQDPTARRGSGDDQVGLVCILCTPASWALSMVPGMRLAVNNSVLDWHRMWRSGVVFSVDCGCRHVTGDRLLSNAVRGVLASDSGEYTLCTGPGFTQTSTCFPEQKVS